MDLITTHISADFDALGSLVAAKKLYPNSRLMLPGSQEKAVRDFLSLAKEAVVFESERECRLYDVTRLVLVDTRQKQRIGIASELVDSGVEVHIYDHHPKMKGDIIADKDVSENVGASVTILADIIKRKNIKIAPLEATIMLLGIYEETGSLTYRTTTKLDVDIVSYLLSKGASLSVVSGYINRELSEAELALLMKLISVTQRVSIKGVTVSIAEIDSAGYAGELGIILHKLMEIENIPLLFVLVDTLPGRVDIIARSNIAAVNLNKVLSKFGGGGHPGAACAKVRGKSVAEVKEKLKNILSKCIRPRVRAKDIMSKPVRTIDVNEKVDEARRILLSQNTEGMPVVHKAKVAGVITIEALNKAVNNGFGHARVKGYMSVKYIRIKADTPLYEIHRAVIDNKIGVLPVFKGRKLIGLVNRTDILKNVHTNLFANPEEVRKKVVSNLSKKMANVLSPEILSLLKEIGRLGNSLGMSVFVVGGVVRDIILGKKNLDLDIVVEGDAIKLGHILSRKLDAAIVVHKRFGTCSVITSQRLKIDLATARTETYEKPAALPTVEFSSLKNDLVRRDFTINAMAISLNRPSFGELVDFFEGEEALASGRIRVMHDQSFIDDPTRIFRAVRFEQRFGFTIHTHTEKLIKHAIRIEMFDKVEPQRIRDEIILILKEENPLKALKRMAQLDELRFLHPRIKLDGNMVRLCREIEKIASWYDASGFKKRSIELWLVYLMAILKDLSYNEALKICDHFAFRKGERLRILSYKKYGDRIATILASRKRLAPSRIYGILEPLSFEVIFLIMAGSPSQVSRARIKDFFRKYNGVKVGLKGKDLKVMGLKPCPDYSKILNKVLYAKIDGIVKTKKDEIDYAKKLVGRICG